MLLRLISNVKLFPLHIFDLKRATQPQQTQCISIKLPHFVKGVQQIIFLARTTE